MISSKIQLNKEKLTICKVVLTINNPYSNIAINNQPKKL